MKNRIQVAAACCALLVAMPGVAMISPERVRQALEEQAKWGKLGRDIQKVMFGGKASHVDQQPQTKPTFKNVTKQVEQPNENPVVISAPVSLKKKVNGICLTSGKLLALFSAGALMEYGLHKGGISHPYLGLMLGGSLFACLGVYEAVKVYKQGTANNHKTLIQ
jgi:hypothetical protein